MSSQKNAPCPCGSGKKTKFCCGDTAIKAEKSLLAAVAHHQAGRLDAAETAYLGLVENRIVKRHALHYLGMIRFQQGNYPLARELIEKALAMEENPVFLTNLGNACARDGDPDRAGNAYRRACEIAPENPEIILNYGHFLASAGKHEDARTLYLHSQTAAMRHARLFLAFARAVFETGDYDTALGLCRKGKALFGMPQELRLLEAGILQLVGDVEGALAIYTSRDLQNHQEARSAWLFTRCARAWPAAECLADHVRWVEDFMPTGQDHELAQLVPPHGNEKGRLRIGYLSGDFRRHAMRFFARPLLAGHDRNRFEVHAFNCSPVNDEITRELSALPEFWHDVAHLNDRELAACIAERNIDFLIDLAGHTKGNRLAVLNMQPAPRQASMLGYLPTLGMKTVRFRITDDAAVPDHMQEAYAEALLRFRQHSQWCYRPDTDTAAIATVDAGAGCRFGAFHNSMKFGNDMLAAWKSILDALPSATLTLVSWSRSEREFMRQRLRQYGIHPEQVIFREPAFGVAYWQLFNEVDIFLDAFPYNGGTVSLDALWMGIPVVSCACDHPAGRGGASILRSIGHPEWCASTPDEYAAQAICLAAHPVRGVAERLALRRQLAASPLMDEAGYMRELEQLICSTLN